MSESSDPRRRPRQERSEATVEALIEATRQILRKDGYVALTTNRIAERAGTSVASVYQYFPNKGALVGALIDRLIAQVLDVVSGVLASTDGLPVEEGVPLIVRAVFDVFRDEAVSRALVSNVPQLERLNPSIQARRNIADLLGQWLASQTHTRVRDPRSGAKLLVNAVYGSIEGALLIEPGLISDPAYIAATAEMLIGYFRGASSHRQ